MRVALPEIFRIRKFQCPIEFDCSLVCLFLVQLAVQNGRLRPLLPDGEGRIESGSSTLGEVGDLLPSHQSFFLGRH